MSRFSFLVRPPRGIVAAVLATSLLGCDDGPSGPDGATRLRVRNASTVELQNLLVVLPTEERIAAVSLAAGGTTGYVAVRTAYRYAYVEASVAGRHIVLQPIDYVGEQPLGAGCFTYDLRVDADQRFLSIAARTETGC
ncbi:hypothetical protein [Roseisolibacter agri]|uniref:Lipoprotein n=1 Tax=Roseisolibacter agri TaxID=2014610 RepID=A0AA37Q836_9BACT|nr:hypothetical protein [Roseisolibacter agri]GLC28324.1 hypothetical protein rosag_48370 [Roseisolibacter agri]